MLYAFLFVLAGFFCPFLHADTLGDRILQERESRLRSLNEGFNPLQENAGSSSLSSVKNIDGNLELETDENRMKTYTLLEAIKTALKNNLDLKSMDLEVQDAKYKRSLDNKVQKFHMDFKTGINKAGNLGQDALNTYHRDIFNVTNRENSFHMGLKMKFPVLDGGHSQALWDKGTRNMEISEIEKLLKKQKLIQDVAKTYIDLILTKERMDTSAMLVDEARTRVATIQRNPTRDNRFPIELLQKKLELETVLQEEARHKSSHRRLKSLFRQQLNLKEDAPFTVDKNAKTRVIKDTLEGFLKAATTKSPELRMIHLKKRILEEENRMARSHKQPQLDIFGKTEYARQVDTGKLDEVRYLLGVELDLNLFDGKETSSRLRRNKNHKDQNFNEHETTKQRIRYEIKSLYQKYLDIKGQVPISLNNLKLARQVLFEAEERFQKRAISKVQLLNARISYKRSILQYYEVIGDLTQTKLSLFASIGRLDEQVFG